MAQCRQTAVEFIRDAYAPMVAVFASQDAERICRKNHLSFTELIQPFCRLASEGRRGRGMCFRGGYEVMAMTTGQSSLVHRIPVWKTVQGLIIFFHLLWRCNFINSFGEPGEPPG